MVDTPRFVTLEYDEGGGAECTPYDTLRSTMLLIIGGPDDRCMTVVRRPATGWNLVVVLVVVVVLVFVDMMLD